MGISLAVDFSSGIILRTAAWAQETSGRVCSTLGARLLAGNSLTSQSVPSAAQHCCISCLTQRSLSSSQPKGEVAGARKSSSLDVETWHLREQAGTQITQ